MRTFKTTILVFLLGITSHHAQVAIGKSSISKLADGITPNPGVSLEFYDNSDNKKGILLPWVSTVANQPVTYNASTGAGYNGMQSPIADGTFILDLSDSKVKYRKSGAWVDLTGSPTFPLTVKDATNNSVVINGFNTIDSSIQDTVKENTDSKAVIGTAGSSDTTTGVLVLSDTDKAMVLPKVASPHLNITNPAPGMMVYDTVSRQLAVYNGTLWSFWRP